MKNTRRSDHTVGRTSRHRIGYAPVLFKPMSEGTQKELPQVLVQKEHDTSATKRAETTREGTHNKSNFPQLSYSTIHQDIGNILTLRRWVARRLPAALVRREACDEAEDSAKKSPSSEAEASGAGLWSEKVICGRARAKINGEKGSAEKRLTWWTTANSDTQIKNQQFCHNRNKNQAPGEIVAYYQVVMKDSNHRRSPMVDTWRRHMRHQIIRRRYIVQYRRCPCAVSYRYAHYFGNLVPWRSHRNARQLRAVLLRRSPRLSSVSLPHGCYLHRPLEVWLASCVPSRPISTVPRLMMPLAAFRAA